MTFYKWNELCLLSLFYSDSTHFYFCRWHKEKISYSDVGQACKNCAAEQDYLYRNKVKKEDSSWLNLFCLWTVKFFITKMTFLQRKNFPCFFISIRSSQNFMCITMIIYVCRINVFNIKLCYSDNGPSIKWIKEKICKRHCARVLLIAFSSFSSLQKHPFLLALRCWGRFAWRNVCDSATEIPYWWCKSMFT